MRFAVTLFLFFAGLFLALGFLVANTQPVYVSYFSTRFPIAEMPLWSWTFLVFSMGLVFGLVLAWLRAQPRRQELGGLRGQVRSNSARLAELEQLVEAYEAEQDAQRRAQQGDGAPILTQG